MAETLTPDICVIGAGPGGLAIAKGAAASGVSTILVECGAPGLDVAGDDSLSSKALLAAAKRAAIARHSQSFGVKASGVTIDFALLRQHIDDAVAALAPNDTEARLAGLGVRVVHGQAVFQDRRTVAVGEEFTIRARRFVVATGAVPAIPAISGLNEGPYFNSETIFALKELPARLVVVGAGTVGLELAQAFRRLGSEVTVLDIAQPLADHDPEAVEIVLAQLEREGVAVRSGVRIAHVDYIAHSVALTIESDNGQDMIEGSHLLIATGRKAAADGLGLDAAQIKHDATGILVNSKLKTSNRRVYAIGGVVAGTTHTVQEAEQQADLVLRHALGHSSPRMTRNAMTRAVFTEPELAQVGLTEAGARRQRVKFRLLRWPYFENARAQAERAVHGHIKVICDNKGKILGVTIVGAQAGELIALWNLAMAQGVNIRVMASLLVPYPTLSEIGQRLAVSSFPPGLTRSWVRRIITWFRTFG